MTKHPIEVITSVERCRRWSREDKELLVAACFEPDAVISEIARAAGIHGSQLLSVLDQYTPLMLFESSPCPVAAGLPGRAPEDRRRTIANTPSDGRNGGG